MEPVTQRHWTLRENSNRPALQAAVAAELDLPPLLVQVLLQRGGNSVEDIRQFLAARLSALPDPNLLPDMLPACRRLGLALKREEKISVHGDYDVDGISGCALLVEGLRALGAEVEYHIPLRLKGGYGLSAEAIRQAGERGCGIVVSVDCGVSAHDEAALATALGLDLIITDHHQPPDQLPPCLALINPQLASDPFPLKELSGVGVAFFLLLGLRRFLRTDGFFDPRPEPDFRRSLDLVALGTIADLVPLSGVNRILVRTGLQLLEQGGRPGVAALKRVADVKAVTSGSVGFRLAPRLNAAGRLEDAALGVELLLNGSEPQCATLARQLDEFNRERQQLEQRTLAEAIAMLETRNQDDYSIVLFGEHWHTGVIGIVASRLVERYHRPTVLIALDGNGCGKGSARSIAGFHLYRALQDCADSLTAFGGHAMAAGLTLDGDTADIFAAAFERVARRDLSPGDLIPQLSHDGEVALESLTLPLLHAMERLEPYGVGNPQPVFVTRDCRPCGVRMLGGKHLKFSVEQRGTSRDCIAFGQAGRVDELTGAIDILFKPGINLWRGNKSMQLQIVDFVAHDTES